MMSSSLSLARQTARASEVFLHPVDGRKKDTHEMRTSTEQEGWNGHDLAARVTSDHLNQQRDTDKGHRRHATEWSACRKHQDDGCHCQNRAVPTVETRRVSADDHVYDRVKDDHTGYRRHDNGREMADRHALDVLDRPTEKV